MNAVVVYGSTIVFIASEVIGIFSGLSIEQALFRSLLLYGVLFVAGSAIVRVLEKAIPSAEESSGSETGTNLDVTTPDISPAVNVAGAHVTSPSLAAAGEPEKEQVHQEVEAAFKQKPQEMAQIISSVMKNE